MEREFKVQMDETWVVRKTVYYTVDAESFDEARRKVEDGYGDWYDSDDWDEDRDCQEWEGTECRLCGADSEDDCDCGDDSDEDDDDEERLQMYGVDLDNNPDYDTPGTVDITEVNEGDVIIPVGEYTTCKNHGPAPYRVTYVRHRRDGDGEYLVEYRDSNDEPWSAYYDDADRFKLVRDPEALEAAEVEATRIIQERQQKQQEFQFLGELLTP